MKDNKVISFIDEYNKRSAEEHKDEIDEYVKLVFNLTFLKLKGLQASGEESHILEDLPYDTHQICQGIDKASDFILGHYSDEDINLITNFPDELSTLAISYITGNSECIALSDLDQI